MRNANLEDERKLHDRGEFDTNVMFQNYRGDKFHTKKLNRCTHIYGDLYAAQQILVESADTNELTVFHRSNLFAIKRGNSEQSKKAPRTKPHVKGTRPETLVPYNNKYMDKPRWMKLRDGARAYFYCGRDFVMNVYLGVFEGALLILYTVITYGKYVENWEDIWPHGELGREVLSELAHQRALDEEDMHP